VVRSTGVPGKWHRLTLPRAGSTAEVARATRAGCDAKAECLSYAMADADLFGIWGGLTAKERARMRQAVA
jgi:WhiB family redox-sensing transcriptional regulator